MTYMSLFDFGNTHLSTHQSQEGEVQATKKIPDKDMSCYGDIPAAPSMGANSAPGIRRYWCTTTGLPFDGLS